MKDRKKLLTAAVCAALTLLLIVLVRLVDVAAIGPEGTSVGLSRLNGAFHGLTGVKMGWYKLTELFGILAILAAAAFALLGADQLIRRKSLAKVDREILLLGGLYLAVIVLYVFFEKVVVNYRPVLMPDGEGPEASFPSSHTMLVCAILGSALLVLGRFIRERRLCLALQALCAVVIFLTVLGRLISGVHWFTDILGGVLISAALLALFSALLDRIPVTERKKGRHER